jgi:hypothetical protein
VFKYLQGRCIDLTDIEMKSLRFHPDLWHWPTRTRWPALLTLATLGTGEAVTVHQTFLEQDGSAKAPLGDKARLFPAGVTPTGGGVWFGEADPSREFIVGEGIESTLSAIRIFGTSTGCAALSEGGIRRLILPPEVRRIRIFADNDELGQGLSAACEAWRRWRDEEREVAVSIADRVGEDANYVLKRRTGEQRAHSLGGADVRRLHQSGKSSAGERRLRRAQASRDGRRNRLARSRV